MLCTLITYALCAGLQPIVIILVIQGFISFKQLQRYQLHYALLDTDPAIHDVLVIQCV